MALEMDLKMRIKARVRDHERNPGGFNRFWHGGNRGGQDFTGKGGLLQSLVGAPLKLKRIADLDLNRDRGVPIPKGLLVNQAEDILNDPDISIVIELIGGLEPARSFILKALEKGKHVVTANKALLAHKGDEIFQKAVGAVSWMSALKPVSAAAFRLFWPCNRGWWPMKSKAFWGSLTGLPIIF